MSFAVLLLTGGQNADGAVVQDDHVVSVHRYRALQLHLRVGHLHVRNALPGFSEERSQTGH